MTATNGVRSCPRCGRPLDETAYVCGSCVARLTADLLRAALGVPELEVAITRQSRVLGRSSASSSEPPVVGPYCGSPCSHESCERIVTEIARGSWGAAAEEPLAREDRLVFNYAASEALWAADNTAQAWAVFVARRRGARPPQPARASAPAPDTEQPTDLGLRCEWSGLLVAHCAHCRGGR